ncbi:MAG: hypothetical protein DRP62_02290 [Planctomycetota bacterium]|nr:MAG: hypothetical protein DRP62_02290 [Planctomycetota bacterium]
MVKYAAFILAVVLCFSNCLADTFTNRLTGETFNGYATLNKKGNKTQVRIEGKTPRYIYLNEYKIQRNHLGRKNKVFIFSINDSIDLFCETEAFEEAIVLAANQGPLFILIKIDTPGGRVDLAQRLCTAITRIDNCDTVAYVNGDKFGGAFSAGAIVALACDKVYMRKGTAIGAAAAYMRTTAGSKAVEKVYSKDISEKFNSAWLGYCAAVAERNNRPGLLVKAMVNANIAVVEVVKNNKRFFITPSGRKSKQTVIRNWSKKGSLLTLTAAEAAQTGIADGMVASQADIFVGLGAAGAGQVRDSSISRARKKFEKARQKLDKILSSISYLENQAAAVAKTLEAAEEQITSFGGVVYDRGYSPYWTLHPGIDIDQWERMLADRDALLDELTDISAALIRGYKKALPLAGKHPDLAYHTASLRKGLESAEATYRETRFRPRYFY